MESTAENQFGEKVVQVYRLDENESIREQDNQVQETSSADVETNPPSISTARWAIQFACLCPGLIMALMDNTIVATSLYKISLHFNSLAGTYWITLGYLLTEIGFGAIFSRVSDHVGRGLTVSGAYAIFLTFSLASGFAQTLTQLIVFRTLQGIGAAGLYSLAFIVTMEISPPKLVPLASAILGFTVALAGIIGPLIGGLFTTYVTWRWIFWVNGPISVLPMLVFPVASSQKLQKQRTRKLGQFDWIGSFLLLSACVLVVFSFQEAGTNWNWSSAKVIATMITGWLCWFALLLWQWSIKEKNIAAIWPYKIVTRRVIVATILSTALTGFVTFATIFTIPLRYQIVNDKSPAWAGVHLLPMLAASGLGSFICAGLSVEKDRTSYTLSVGAACLVIGSGLLTTLANGLSVQGKEYGFQFIFGLGIGLSFASLTMLTAKEITSPEHHAVMQGIVAQLRVFGGALGIAISNAILNGEARHQLRGILSDSAIQSLQTSTDVLLSLSEAERTAVRDVYAKSFTDTMRLCIGVSAVALIASFITFRRAR